MMRLIFSLIISLLSLVTINAQEYGRDLVLVDSVNTYKMCAITIDSSDAIHMGSIWSDDIRAYSWYSRIEMGRRMNEAIKYQNNAKYWFQTGTVTAIGASVCFIAAAWTDPVVYIEGTIKYDREYFNNAKRHRNGLIIMGAVWSGVSLYSFHKSYKCNRKATWMISPDGVRLQLKF